MLFDVVRSVYLCGFYLPVLVILELFCYNICLCVEFYACIFSLLMKSLSQCMYTHTHLSCFVNERYFMTMQVNNFYVCVCMLW